MSAKINKINNFSVGFVWISVEGRGSNNWIKTNLSQPTLITQEHVPYQSTCSYHSFSHFIIQPFPEKRTRSDRALRAVSPHRVDFHHKYHVGPMNLWNNANPMLSPKTKNPTFTPALLQKLAFPKDNVSHGPWKIAVHLWTMAKLAQGSGARSACSIRTVLPILVLLLLPPYYYYYYYYYYYCYHYHHYYHYYHHHHHHDYYYYYNNYYYYYYY